MSATRAVAWAFLLAMIVPSAAAAPSCDGALDLEVTLPKGKYRPAEPVVVRIMMVARRRVVSSAADMCMLPPGFVSEPEPNFRAYLYARMTLTRPDGTTVTGLQRPSFAIPVRPRIDEFRRFTPGSLFGISVPLQEDPLALPLDQVGRYTLQVSVSSGARSWLRDQVSEGRVKKTALKYPLDSFFEGALDATVDFVVE